MFATNCRMNFQLSQVVLTPYMNPGVPSQMLPDPSRLKTRSSLLSSQFRVDGGGVLEK